MDVIRGERERRAGDDAWVSGLNNSGIGGSISGNGDMRTAGGGEPWGTVRWDRGLGTMQSKGTTVPRYT